MAQAPRRVSHVRQPILRALAIGLAAAALLWPAFVNGLPLLFPDSIDYLIHSHPVFDKLRGQPVPEIWVRCIRSETYPATLRLLHYRGNLWAIVIVQSLLTAWIIWLIVRVLCPHRPLRIFLLTALLLASLGGLAWYTSFVMPDLFGSLLYLSLFLLVFRRRLLSRWEAFALTVFSVWAITAHSSHLLVASILCLLFAGLRLAHFPGLPTSRVLVALGIVLAAVLTQIAVHARVDGRASLFGDAPPFLIARMLNDGPARLYLNAHCATLPWKLCEVRNQIPADAEDILWDPEGIWQSASQTDHDRLRHEQTLLLVATLRAYPLQQLRIFVRDAARSLVDIGPNDFSDFPSTFTFRNMEFASRSLTGRYARSLQAHNGLPQLFFRRLQLPLVVVCFLVAVALLPRTLANRRFDLLGLAIVIVAAVLANAVVCGVLSGVYPRYGGRVSWLLVFLACMLVAGVFGNRDASSVSAR